jgi:hypothetical protein
MRQAFCVTLVLILGCDGSQDSTAPTVSGTPAPLVSMEMRNGNTVEIYDFDTGALVTERGVPPTQPVMGKSLNLPRGADHLVDLFVALRPYAKDPLAQVPDKLIALQARLTGLSQAPPPQDTARVTAALSSTTQAKGSRPTGGATLLSEGGVMTNSPVGCNNGCCDWQWEHTIYPCNQNCSGNGFCNEGGGTWGWNWFNIGTGTANKGGTEDYVGFVCSAQGTSSWSIQIGDGTNKLFQVNEATYLIYSWDTGIFGIDRQVNTNTNAQTQHLHTYCGWFN